MIPAAEQGHLEVVEFLVAHGANISAGNYRALEKATENKHTDVVHLLLQQYSTLKPALYAKIMGKHSLGQAARNGNTTLVRLLLEFGADVHVRKDKAVFGAADEGHLESAKLLLQYGGLFDRMQGRAPIRGKSKNDHLGQWLLTITPGAANLAVRKGWRGCHEDP